MQSIAIVILGIIGMMFGWFVYSKFIASRIFKLDDSFVTPAHTEQDGVDFVPTNKVVLWGAPFHLGSRCCPPLLDPLLRCIGAGFPRCYGLCLAQYCLPVCTIWAPCGPVHAIKANQWGHYLKV